MNVGCPECNSVFRVDPARVPARGVRARCSICGGIIAVEAGGGDRSGAPWPPSASVASPTPGALEMRNRPTPVFGAAQAPPVTPTPPAAERAPSPASSPATTPPWQSPAAGTPPSPGVAFGAREPGASAGAAPLPTPSRATTPDATPVPPTPAQPTFAQPTPAEPTRSATPADAAPPAPPPWSAPAAYGTTGPSSARPPINPFLSNDPNQKAKRLARALVSDIVAYHPQLREQGLRDGTLRQLLKDEIKKSYEEYLEQVGKEFADGTTHFQEALNEILAGGRQMF